MTQTQCARIPKEKVAYDSQSVQQKLEEGFKLASTNDTRKVWKSPPRKETVSQSQDAAAPERAVSKSPYIHSALPSPTDSAGGLLRAQLSAEQAQKCKHGN